MLFLPPALRSGFATLSLHSALGAGTKAKTTTNGQHQKVPNLFQDLTALK